MGKGCRSESSADNCSLVFVALINNLCGLGPSWMFLGGLNEEFVPVPCWSLKIRIWVLHRVLKGPLIRWWYLLRSKKRKLATRESSFTGDKVLHKNCVS